MTVTEAARTARTALAYLYREAQGDLRDAASASLTLLEAAGVSSEPREPE